MSSIERLNVQKEVRKEVMAVCRDHVKKEVEDPAGELATPHCQKAKLSTNSTKEVHSILAGIFQQSTSSTDSYNPERNSFNIHGKDRYKSLKTHWNGRKKTKKDITFYPILLESTYAYQQRVFRPSNFLARQGT